MNGNAGNIEADTGSTKRKIRSIWIGILVRISVFAASVGFVFTFLFGVWICDSRDMYPAVREGDLVMYYRTVSPARQDTVVYEFDGELRIGRVAAMSGDVLGKTRDGKLTMNGKIQPVQPRRGIYEETMAEKFAGRTLSENEIFLLGDARDEAVDSRELGTVSKENIQGKVFMLWRRRGI